MKQQEAYNAIRQHYWWPGLRTFVKNYVQGCGTCQQFKIDRTPSKPAYIPTEGAKSSRPFANCSMDLITDLPLQLYLGRGRPRPFEGGNFSTLQEVNHFRRHSTATFGKPL